MKTMREQRRAFYTAIPFLLPWIIGFSVFTLYPILSSLYYSLCNYTVVNPPEFIGLRNFINLFTNDAVYIRSLQNSLYVVFVGLTLSTLVTLTVSIMLNNKLIKGLSFFRVVFFIPTLVPIVINCILWYWILMPDGGLLNTVLGFIGIEGPGWISSPAWAKPALILMMIWGSGGAVILYLAGLQEIPPALYESASIDGANFFKRTIHITLPMLSPVILFNTVTGIIGVLQWFAEPLIMTKGGPDNSTMFYALNLYQNAFQYFKMGYASAMAWVLLVIALIFVWILFKLNKRFGYSE
jgi:multiple sugar transport system permease protein